MDQLDLDFGMCVQADYDDDNHLQIQTDSPGVDDFQGTQPAEALHPHGFHSRPLDLDPNAGDDQGDGLGAPCLEIFHGDRRFVMPLNDPRDVIENRIPKLRKGGSMLAGGAGDHRSWLMFEGEDPAGVKQPGSLTIAVSYNKGGSKKSLALTMDVRTSGSESISLVHADGARITLNDKAVTMAAPDGSKSITSGNSGNVLAGSTKVQGGLNVGDPLGVVPVPLWPQLLAYLQILEASVIKGNAGGPIVVAAPLASMAATIASKHLKTT